MKIFAHRGASKEAPENSLKAFRIAMELEVDGMEVDCFLTKDKVPVVTHYNDLKILKLGRGLLHQITWAEVEPTGIPTLTQVLELARPTHAEVILDLKAQPGFMQIGPRIIAGLAQEILPASRLLCSSFYFRHLLSLKRHLPHLPRALIAMQGAFKLVPARIFDKFLVLRAFHPLLQWTDAALVRQWQYSGMKVHVWVANTTEELQRCRELGVDGLFTDDPRLAVRVLSS